MQKIILFLSSLLMLLFGGYVVFLAFYHPKDLDSGEFTIPILIIGMVLVAGGLATSFIFLKSNAQLSHVPMSIKLVFAVMFLGLMWTVLLRFLI